jgi:hypothetical protein
MALTKNDLKEIKKVVEDVVEEKIDNLAIMTKKSFDGQDRKISYLTKEVKGIRKDLAIHDFKMTEMACPA